MNGLSQPRSASVRPTNQYQRKKRHLNGSSKLNKNFLVIWNINKIKLVGTTELAAITELPITNFEFLIEPKRVSADFFLTPSKLKKFLSSPKRLREE